MATETTEKRELSYAEKAIELSIDAIHNTAHQLHEDAEACDHFHDRERDLLTAEAEGMEAAARIIQTRLDAGMFRPSAIDAS